MTSEPRDSTSSSQRRWARASDGLIASLMWRARARAAKRARPAKRPETASPGDAGLKPKANRREATR